MKADPETLRELADRVEKAEASEFRELEAEVYGLVKYEEAPEALHLSEEYAYFYMPDCHKTSIHLAYLPHYLTSLDAVETLRPERHNVEVRLPAAGGPEAYVWPVGSQSRAASKAPTEPQARLAAYLRAHAAIQEAA